MPHDPMAWRSIASAPKDGTRIWGKDASRRVRLTQWGKHNHVPLYGWIRQLAKDRGTEEVEGWAPLEWQPHTHKEHPHA